MSYESEIREAFAKIGKRKAHPLPWRDVKRLPWHDDEFSKSFLAAEELPPETGEDEAQFIFDHLQGEKVLELGCGGGRTARSLLSLAQDVHFVGVDVGFHPLLVAWERCPKGDFARADMLSLPFKNSLFDMIFCVYGAFLGFRRQEALSILRKTKSLLANKGVFILEFPSPNFLASLNGVQEWWVGDSSFAGDFPQVGMSENIHLANRQVYIRRDYVVDLRDGKLKEYGQTNCLYDEFEIRDLLERSGFTVRAIYGDWDCQPFNEASERLIAITALKD